MSVPSNYVTRHNDQIDAFTNSMPEIAHDTAVLMDPVVDLSLVCNKNIYPQPSTGTNNVFLQFVSHAKGHFIALNIGPT